MWLPTCLAVLSIENSKTVRNSNYLERHSLGKLSIIFMLHPLNKEISEMPWLSLNHVVFFKKKKNTKHNMQCPQTLFWQPTDRTHLKCAGHLGHPATQKDIINTLFHGSNLYRELFTKRLGSIFWSRQILAMPITGVSLKYFCFGYCWNIINIPQIHPVKV